MPLPCDVRSGVLPPFSWTDTSRVRVYTYWLTGTSKFGITNAAKKSRKSFQANSWWSEVQTTKLPCLWNDAKAGIVPLAWTTSPPTSGGSEAAIPRLRQKLICLKTMAEVRRTEISKISKSVAECHFSLSAALVGMLIQSSSCFTEIKSCICMILGFGVQEWFYPQHRYLIHPWFYFSILDEQSKIRSFPKNLVHHLMCMNFTHIYNHTRENRCHYVNNHNNAIFSGNPSKSPAICMFVSPQMGKLITTKRWNHQSTWSSVDCFEMKKRRPCGVFVHPTKKAAGRKDP